jgi:hypothetical protein
MCEPVSIIAGTTAVIGAGSAIAGHVGAANARAKNSKAAYEAGREEQRLIGLRQQQEVEGASLTIMQADRKAREADALARVSAGESGVAGASVDLLLADLERQRLEFSTGTKRNLQNQLDQGQMEKQAAFAGTRNRIASTPGPNPFLTGLQIAGSGLDAAGSYYATKPKP